MSKIQSESNSQLYKVNAITQNSCDQYVKDTIWKQFTTFLEQVKNAQSLWPICQRYNLKAIHNEPTLSSTTITVVTNMSKIQSESNSQLKWVMKLQPKVVTNMSKIQSESNSQLFFNFFVYLLSCDQYVKDTIWKQFTTVDRRQLKVKPLWPICQRYNLKAIHNSTIRNLLRLVVVTNMSKIQSESNSQLWCLRSSN